jgi:hypothetical protein
MLICLKILRSSYAQFTHYLVNLQLKKGALEELAKVHDMGVISFRPIYEVRWLSRHFAVSAFVRNLDALAAYCEEQVQDCNDPVCSYVLKSLRDPLYQVALYTVNDVLTELANLSLL